MPKAVEFTTGVEGMEVSINYNDVTMRLTSIDWVILPGYQCFVEILDNGTPIYDVVHGAGSGSFNIPGSYGITVGGDGLIQFPPGLSGTFEIKPV